MLLVIDVGNSNVVLGVFREKTLAHSWRVRTCKDRTVDEYGVLLHNLFTLQGLSLQAVESVVVSSVVPPLNDRLTQLSRRYFGKEPLFVEPASQKVIPVLYTPPSDVGADRIVNALAAFELVGGPAIIVDFGTATTFDAISALGEYLGGVIVPGVRISADALFVHAARLPRIEIKEPSRVIGDCTVAAMQSGIFYGYVSLVEGVLRRMKQELGPASVIATGGLAARIAYRAEGIDRIEEDLTLQGLRLFHERFLA
ncbi:MAG: type III pantothenate kinase [Acidobacteria bacterium]|nr:MAG: type III pantothenate kinase [Acidobacteriota bacterium]